MRVETGAAASEQKLKVTVRTADLAQQGNPGETFGPLKNATMETDNKSKSTVMK